MKVCYFGTYRQQYSRNKIMIAALEAAGIDVVLCHATLWRGIEDRVETTKGGWKRPSFWWRVLTAYTRLIWRFLHVRDFDILMVGYPGQFDVFLAKLFSKLRRKPLVWDVFMSIYLVAKERMLDRENHFTVNLIRKIEARALSLPDRLIQDTSEYVRWFQNEYGLSPERFSLVPTGADNRIFDPTKVEPIEKSGDFQVLYYGTYIPNHGVMKMAEAIRLLAHHEDIQFEFIGDGPDKIAFEGFLIQNGIGNVRLVDWMTPEELLTHIAGADLCLGAFGDTPQSLMTIQNKIYECMAMGKAIITGESPAVNATLPQEVILTCDRDNPQELAEIILMLKNDPEKLKQLGESARVHFNAEYSIESLGQKLKSHLESLLTITK